MNIYKREFLNVLVYTSAQPPKTPLLDMTTTDPCGPHYTYVHQGKTSCHAVLHTCNWRKDRRKYVRDGRRERWRKLLLDGVKETRRYWKLKEDALDLLILLQHLSWTCRKTDYWKIIILPSFAMQGIGLWILKMALYSRYGRDSWKRDYRACKIRPIYIFLGCADQVYIQTLRNTLVGQTALNLIWSWT